MDQLCSLWNCEGDVEEIVMCVCGGEGCDKFEKLNMNYKVTNSHLPSPYLMMLYIRQGKSRAFHAVL